MTAGNDMVAWLRGTEFLKALSSEDLHKLAALCSRQTLPAGAVLFEQGEVRHTVYVLSEGLVALEVCLPRRGCIRIQTLGPGDLLGWSALLADGCMTARALTLEPTTLLAFEAEPLKRLCEEDHDVGYAVMRQTAVALSRRLLAARLQLLDMFRETEPVPASTSFQQQPRT